MAARRVCQSLSPDLRDPNRGQAMLPIKASCATSGGRSSRATKSALSKSAERIRSDDELSRNRAFGGSERACYPILLQEAWCVRVQLLPVNLSAAREVAQRAGFEDDERMRRSFLRYLGISPSEYNSRFAGFERQSPQGIASADWHMMRQKKARRLAARSNG